MQPGVWVISAYAGCVEIICILSVIKTLLSITLHYCRLLSHRMEFLKYVCSSKYYF